jgi:precorrin-2 dehydrogenase/sirohydrochlorin ferrochelatase
MKTFPILLDLHGRRAVVVGGGRVGMRKARALADAHAQVVLVDAGADETAEATGMTIVPQPYRKELLQGAFLVFACTDDRSLNQRIAADARTAGAMVNVADRPEECDFYLPAAWSDGDVVVAVGTGGAAPALAAHLRDSLAALLPPRIGAFAQTVGELRETLRQKVPDRKRRGEILRRLCSKEVLEAFLAEGPEAVHRKLDQLIGGQEPVR